MKTITRVIATGVVAGALALSGVAGAVAAEANTSKKNTTNTNVVKKDKGKKQSSRVALPRTEDGFPDLSRNNLKAYKMNGVSLEVVPVDPNNQVITQDYFVIAKGFTGPVKVRVDGWELSMTEFDFKYHPEDYELGKAAVQEFTVPGNGKHRITVTHPYHLLCVMIHAKAGDQKGNTAGTQFEVNAVYDSAQEQAWHEEMDAWSEETGLPNPGRPSVHPAKPPKK